MESFKKKMQKNGLIKVNYITNHITREVTLWSEKPEYDEDAGLWYKEGLKGTCVRLTETECNLLFPNVDLEKAYNEPQEVTVL